MARTAALTTDFLTRAANAQSGHARSRSADSQKLRGQFFTPPPVARLMAAMLTGLPGTIRVLDPGAGAGMLSAAVCERIAELRAPRHVEIHAYETDRALLNHLHAALAASRGHLASRGHSMTFTIHDSDFILHGPGLPGADLFSGPRFNVAILNPPYLKIGKESPYALAMSELVHGQPNLYALFMALAANCLEPDGQFVSITPRSFCDGPYFRSFRQWFLSRISIERMHLFESRTAAFAESDVLQESVITCGHRKQEQAGTIALTHTPRLGASHAHQPLEFESGLIIRGPDRTIRLPASEAQAAVTRAVDSWPDRFEQHGLRISTGPIVQFRAAGFIHRGHGERSSIPLLAVQNVHPFRATWPPKNPAKTLSFDVTPESRRLLIRAGNYVLLRRFSAKEEARRLVAAPVFEDSFQSPWLALENHLNYVYHATRSLTRDESTGIACMFNSRLLDLYFRAVSGNTQVNASAVRALPFPALPILARLGQAVGDSETTDPLAVERAVLDTLGIDGPFREQLLQAQDHRSLDDPRGSGPPQGPAKRALRAHAPGSRRPRPAHAVG